MKSKLKYLINYSLKKRIKSKTFLITNIIFLVLIVGLLNIDTIIKIFSKDQNNIENPVIIYINDNTNEVYNSFENKVTLAAPYIYGDKVVKIINKNTVEDIETLLKEKKEDILITFNKDTTNYLNVEITTFDQPDNQIELLLNQLIKETKIEYASKKEKLNNSIYNKVYSDVEINYNLLNKEKEEEAKNQDILFDIGFGFIIMPFFMVTMFVISLIGAEINEEKTSRSMEIIISSVNPLTHLISKVLSVNIYILIQGLLFIFYLLIGLGTRVIVTGKGVIESFVSAEIALGIKEFLKANINSEFIIFIGLVLLLLVLTIVAYSLLAAILASMTTNAEDFQQLQTPLVMISLLAYYATFIVKVAENNIIVKSLSYFPLVSSTLLPGMITKGSAGLNDLLIAIAILILFLFLLAKYGMKVYRVGILNYSSDGLWKKVFKSIKN